MVKDKIAEGKDPLTFTIRPYCAVIALHLSVRCHVVIPYYDGSVHRHSAPLPEEKVGAHFLRSGSITTGSLQGSVLSPLLYTHNCSSSYSVYTIFKLLDDTTAVTLCRG